LQEEKKLGLEMFNRSTFAKVAPQENNS